MMAAKPGGGNGAGEKGNTPSILPECFTRVYGLGNEKGNKELAFRYV